MIRKIVKGKRVGGLVRYLFGPGRANEHVDPRVVGGWLAPADLEPAMTARGVRGLPAAHRQARPASGHARRARPMRVALLPAERPRGSDPD